MKQRHPATSPYLKQKLPHNLALKPKIVLFPAQPLKPSISARTAPENVCSIPKLCCKLARKIGWVEICCARFLDATGVLGATRELVPKRVLDAMAAGSA